MSAAKANEIGDRRSFLCVSMAPSLRAAIIIRLLE